MPKRLTVSMGLLAHDEVLLLVLDLLEPSRQVPDFPLDRQHLPVIRHINDAMHVEADRLVADRAELVREAVFIPPIVLGGEGVGARVFAVELEEPLLAWISKVRVDVEVPSASHLVGKRHLHKA